MNNSSQIIEILFVERKGDVKYFGSKKPEIRGCNDSCLAPKYTIKKRESYLN